MQQASPQRGQWGRSIGFILAGAGSAIGLGNLWRFPTLAGQSGGAVFVLIYIVCVVLVGFPVMLAELSLGRHTQRNVFGTFQKLAPGTAWIHVGTLGVLTALAILSYYSVVASWSLGYLAKTLTGTFRDLHDPTRVDRVFAAMTAAPGTAVGLHAVFMALTMAVVVGGVQRGIERWSKVLMPFLFGILLLLVVRSVTLDGAARGLAFYLKPDFSQLRVTTFLNALSQAFFSLSLGMGIMVTYGSYLSKRENLVVSSFWICFMDTLIAILAGFAIFPALFTLPGLEPAAGPRLIFLVLPHLFDKIPGGQWFGAGFFLLFILAALTSSISLLEVVVAYFIDEHGWRRRRAVTVVGLIAFLLGVPSALGNGAVAVLSRLPGLHLSFLELMDTVFGKFTIITGAFFLSVFLAWRWGVHAAVAEIFPGPARHWLARPWAFLIRWICPLLILLIFLTVL